MPDFTFDTITKPKAVLDTLSAGIAQDLGDEATDDAQANANLWLRRALTRVYRQQKIQEATRSARDGKNVVIDSNRDRLAVAQKTYDDAVAAAEADVKTQFPGIVGA